MAAQIAIVDPLKNTDWNEMLLGLGHSTVFHSSNWARLLTECYGYHPTYFTLWDRGVFKGCLPLMEVQSVITGRRGVCLSFSDYCGAVVETRADFELLFERALHLGKMKGWRYVEFRGEEFLAAELAAKS